MKKAQINQAFIFIFMIIIIGSIALISFQLFGKGKEAACDADIATFKSNLQKLSSSFTDFGTVNIKDVKVPCNYETVCFISTEDFAETGGSDYFVIQEYLGISGSERDNNVFLVKDDKAEPLALIPEITTPDQNAVCINRQGSFFKMKFTGEGQKVELNLG